MSDLKGISFVILPQALRLSIPGWSNEYSIVLKDSAVVFALGLRRSWRELISLPRAPTSISPSILPPAPSIWS